MKAPLKKHTLNLRDGDFDYLSSVYGPKHLTASGVIQILVSAHVDKLREQVSEIDPTEIGRTLWSANAISVDTYYEHSLRHEPAEPLVDSYEFKDVHLIDALTFLKALDCLDYQSCDYDGWNVSDAKQILDDWRRGASAKLPGYDACAWGLEEHSRRLTPNVVVLSTLRP